MSLYSGDRAYECYMFKIKDIKNIKSLTAYLEKSGFVNWTLGSVSYGPVQTDWKNDWMYAKKRWISGSLILALDEEEGVLYIIRFFH
jgi:hypothetical protein